MTATDEGVLPADAGPSDGSLLRCFRRGSQEAATQIYLRYAQRLRALTRAKCSTLLARRVEIDDIVQSVFGSFFRGASQGYYDVPAGEELWKLFLIIALNKIRAKGNFHRRAKRDARRTRGSAVLDSLGESEATREEAAFLEVAIEDALERLPVGQRQLVLLRVEGHEVAEIAARTGQSKRTVERLLQKARKQLTQLFETEGEHGDGASAS